MDHADSNFVIRPAHGGADRSALERRGTRLPRVPRLALARSPDRVRAGAGELSGNRCEAAMALSFTRSSPINPAGGRSSWMRRFLGLRPGTPSRPTSRGLRIKRYRHGMCAVQAVSDQISVGSWGVQRRYAARTSVSWIWQRERQARSAQLHQDDCMASHDRPPRNKFTSTLTQPYLDNGPVLNWPADNRMFPRRRRPAHIDSSMSVPHSCRGLRYIDRF
ncbi:hypothetical protein L226DRAFT_97711 [Lentinus tigrinus ALCF2SS1-7]|uniref:uncharacterized protein n=1 Tax=Lentinus tigrinus ALCF2SS1-7 TaxID=1328758 RepID=UPI001165FEE2|nr:hypothetical protein L226DRAFT_97711 [Lentinus tigrinus ALCF2SS1-7]